jgi:hypothetical protein
MRFRIEREGWVVGQYLIPAGTVIDDRVNDQWTQIAKGHVPPLNAVALDQEAFDLMKRAYQWGGLDQVRVGPGVVKR